MLRADAGAVSGYGTEKFTGEMGVHHYRRQLRDKCAQSLASYPGDGVLEVGGRRYPTSP